MSDKAIRVFIFTEKKSKRILMIKKSRDLDFTVRSSNWDCHRLVSDQPAAISTSISHAWDPVTGVTELGEPASSDIARLQLLQKKLEILLALKANLQVIWSQAKQDISNQMISKMTLQSENVVRLLKLLEVEKKQLRTRSRFFFNTVQRKIEAADNLHDLNCEYQNIINNVTLGGYAVFSRDI